MHADAVAVKDKDMDNAQSINEYLSVLRHQRQLSPHTLSNYQLDLQELLSFAKTQTLANLSYFDIRRFTSQLHAQGLNPRSIARKLSSWRGYYRWLAEHTALAANPVDGVKAPKKSKSLPKALGTDEAVNLVAHQAGEACAALADKAMFELLYSSGLRVSELVALDLRDFSEATGSSLAWIDLEQAEVHVTGKGNKQRIVPVGQAALQAVQAWLAVRGQLVKTDPRPLFLNARGSRMSVRSVQLRLKQHAQKAGINSDVHPHVLRHSFASHVLQSSGDLRAVQEMLGHSSIAATQVYTALDFQHLAQVYDAAHPRAKSKK